MHRPPRHEWEVEAQAYSVYFWHQRPAQMGTSQERVMFHSDEYRLSGAADIGEVLDWARATAGPDQTFTLYVEHRHDDRPGLIHLMGVDPTVPT